MKLKKCANPKCNCAEFQPIDNFYKNKSTTDGYQAYCKSCITVLRKQYHLENKEKILENKKLYYLNNKEIILKYKKEYIENLARYKTYYKKLSKYEECRPDPNNFDLLQVKCFNANCNAWFNPKKLQVKNRLGSINGTTNGENHFYCSNACKQACVIFHKKTKIKNNPCTHTENSQSELREIVLERDNFTCQKCGKTKKENPELQLVCHHIIPRIKDLIFSADIDNCLTLCSECHSIIHKQHGCRYTDLKT